MTTIIASAETFGISGLADILRAAGPARRARQFVVFTGVTCAVMGRRIQRAVSLRKEATARRLENFVLELLAAIVLIAIFLIVTDPAARDDPDVDQSDVPSTP
jgi:hypothetical protein